MTRKQRQNAERIVTLADAFGRLPINAHGQTVEGVLNLSIPCARLICHGIVTAVVDSCDAVNDDAVAGVERTCLEAVRYASDTHGPGWWNGRAAELLSQ